MEEFLVSVIVPVYNVGKYLRAALDSIVRQTYRNLEIICVNDGSTDSSPAILREYAAKDPQIVVVEQKNQGLSGARNAGLNRAHGLAIAFVDPDDLLAENAIELMARHLGDGVDGVVCGINVRYDGFSSMKEGDDRYFSLRYEGKVTPDADVVSRTYTPVWGKLYRKSLVDDLRLRFPEPLVFEDNFWHWAFFMNARAMYFLDVPAYTYVRHPDSIMGSVFAGKEHLAIQRIRIIERIIDFLAKRSLYEFRKDVRDRLVTDYFNASFADAPDYEKPEIVSELSKVLRRTGYDCSPDSLLGKIKAGTFYPDAILKISDLERESSELRERIHGLERGKSGLEREIGERESELSRSRAENTRLSAEVRKWKRKALRMTYYRYVLLSRVTFGKRRRHYRKKVRRMRAELGFR